MAPAVTPELALRAAQAILAVHLASAAFIIGGVGAIALGHRLGWRWTREPRWRLAHVVHAIADDVIHVPLPLSFAVAVYTAVWCFLVVLWLRLPGRRPARA